MAPVYSSDEFFRRRREWSKYKHEILNKYLRIWVYKLGSAHREMAFVDACAGAGTYDNGVEGSPVIAAQWNDSEEFETRNNSLFVHACEQMDDSARDLRAALEPWINRDPPLARVYVGPFASHLEEILNATRRVPTMFFIDPYGLKTITAESIRPLLDDRQRASTEVLVRADPTLLARFAGWVRGAEGEHSETWHRTAESFRGLLRSLNVNVDDVASASYSPDAMGLFGEYLELFRKRFRFVQLVPIRPSYFAAAKYYLIHGTDSPHGCAKLNDAVSTTEDSLFAETMDRRARGQLSIFGPPQREPRVTPADAAPIILNWLESVGKAKFVEAAAVLALHFGPDLREKDHKRAVRELIRSGQIQCESANALTDNSVLIHSRQTNATPRRGA